MHCHFVSAQALFVLDFVAVKYVVKCVVDVCNYQAITVQTAFIHALILVFYVVFGPDRNTDCSNLAVKAAKMHTAIHATEITDLVRSLRCTSAVT